MHVYFALLVSAKPALAATEATDKAPVKVGVVKQDGQKQVTVETAVQDEDAQVAGTATNESSNDDNEESSSEKGISISINAKDGINIKGEGAEKILAKLKALEDKYEDGDDDSDRAVVASTSGSISKTLENVLVPIVLFALAFGFASYVVYAKQKNRKETLDTIRTMAQNNQPIPPELLANLKGTRDAFVSAKGYGDVNSIQGVKYVFIGIGLGGFLLLLDAGYVAGALGFIFIVIGVFNLVKSRLMEKHLEAEEKAAATPPAAPVTTTPSNTL